MMTPAVLKKMRLLAKALTAKDLRDLAVAFKVQDAASQSRWIGIAAALRAAAPGRASSLVRITQEITKDSRQSP